MIRGSVHNSALNLRVSILSPCLVQGSPLLLGWEGCVGWEKRKGKRAFQVCRALDPSAGLSIEGERQDFTEIETRMVAAFLLGGGGDGWMAARGYKLTVIRRIRSAGLMGSLATIINNMAPYA